MKFRKFMFYTVVIMVATVFAVGVAYAPIEPEIELLKEVSVDGGVTFFDANDSASAPATAVGGGALYRLTVTNTGTSDLENVVINDATLGIVDFPVGNLAAGQTVVLTAGEIPQLDQPGRCQDPGDVTNIATVDGQSVNTGSPVMDSDPAVVRCVEVAIDLLKEVSVDGGVTFFDANDSASAPATAVGGGALYRLTVTNTGTSDLENVVINDATLGIVDFLVGNLAAGQTVVLTAGEIPQLDQPGRCEVPGDVTNIATVDGDSVDTGNTVSDSDPAVVRCEEKEGCLTSTPGFWCTHDRVTELFLPVDSCGITLDNIEAASPGSAIEDLDFSGRDFKANDTSPQQLQLVRQCTAAALNFAASAQAGGSCSGIVLSDGRTIDEVFAACCEDLCTSGASGSTISESNCIERLDEFNNLEPDTLTCETDPQAPFPFCPSLGANGFNATPETCQEANGNGFVNPGRNLGPKNGGGSNGDKGMKKGKK